MTASELHELSKLRYRLRKTGYFAFEKDGKYLLYHEVAGGRNQKVLTSKSITEFVRKTVTAVGLGDGS